jgi:hypothetical protein
MISDSLTKSMATLITMKKDITLNPGATVSLIAKKGQKVKSGQPLIIFENAFDDSSINDILSKIGDEFNKDIQELTNKVVKSKYTGTIVDIKIYYNRPIEEFSPSLQKIIKSYIRTGKNKLKKINDVRSNVDQLSLNVNIPTIEQVESEKISGQPVDGVLIEFYIEYEDELGVGDKIKR